MHKIPYRHTHGHDARIHIFGQSSGLQLRGEDYAVSSDRIKVFDDRANTVSWIFFAGISLEFSAAAAVAPLSESVAATEYDGHIDDDSDVTAGRRHSPAGASAEISDAERLATNIQTVLAASSKSGRQAQALVAANVNMHQRIRRLVQAGFVSGHPPPAALVGTKSGGFSGRTKGARVGSLESKARASANARVVCSPSADSTQEQAARRALASKLDAHRDELVLQREDDVLVAAVRLRNQKAVGEPSLYVNGQQDVQRNMEAFYARLCGPVVRIEAHDAPVSVPLFQWDGEGEQQHSGQQQQEQSSSEHDALVEPDDAEELNSRCFLRLQERSKKLFQFIECAAIADARDAAIPSPKYNNVELSGYSTTDDQHRIHANYVELPAKKLAIAAQYPQPFQFSIGKFWRMALQKQARLIIDLSQSTDMLSPYYPLIVNEMRSYDGVDVILLSRRSNYSTYKVTDTRVAQSAKIVRYHFRGWYDAQKIAPQKLALLAQLINHNHFSRIILHGEFGIGRTASACVATIIMDKIEKGVLDENNKDVILDDIILSLREQRGIKVVPTPLFRMELSELIDYWLKNGISL